MKFFKNQVDLRTLSFDIPSQEILTKDSVTVRVDAVCYYKKVDATKSVCEVEDADLSTVSISIYSTQGHENKEFPTFSDPPQFCFLRL